MRKIVKILRREKHTSNVGQEYQLTIAQVDDGSECSGYGVEFEVGDLVEVYFSYNKIKMKKPGYKSID